MKKDLRIPFNDGLNDKDSENQTFGCRQRNPEICGNNGLAGVCAFVSDDFICKKPSRAWKKQYYKLLEKQQ